MPPRRSTSASGSTSISKTRDGRKPSSSISSAFRASGAKSSSTSSAFFNASAVKPGSRSSSLNGSNLKSPAEATVSVPRAVSRSASPEKKQKEERPLSKEEAEEAEHFPELDIDDPSYTGIWKVVQRQKLGKVGPIHAEGQNKVHHILRTFDLDPAYGPCLGLTRLERWTRAKELGEEPPVEVFEILQTKEGRTKAEYRENCLAGSGV